MSSQARVLYSIIGASFFYLLLNAWNRKGGRLSLISDKFSSGSNPNFYKNELLVLLWSLKLGSEQSCLWNREGRRWKSWTTLVCMIWPLAKLKRTVPMPPSVPTALASIPSHSLIRPREISCHFLSDVSIPDVSQQGSCFCSWRLPVRARNVTFPM